MPKQTARSRALVASRPAAGNQRGPKQPQQQSARNQSGQKQERKQSRDYALTAYLKCLTDPFNNPPCRLPDMYAGATVVFALTQDFTLRSDANGRIAFIVSPALNRSTYTPVLDAAGSSASVTYQAHDDYTATLAGYTWTRMVCGGIMAQYIGAQQTAAGWISIVEDPDLNYFTVGSNVAGKSEDGFSGPATAGGAATWVPCQEPRLDATTNVGGNTPTFSYFFIFGEGLPANTDCFRLRTIRHIEGPPTKANLARRSAMPGHASTAELEAASAISPLLKPSSGESAVRTAVVKAAEAVGVKAIEYGTAKALDFAATRFPTMLMLGM